MKIIEGIEKEIVLEDKDILIVSSMKGNKIKLRISCIAGSLQIDDVPVEKIQNLKEEEKAIQAMKKYKREKSQK